MSDEDARAGAADGGAAAAAEEEEMPATTAMETAAATDADPTSTSTTTTVDASALAAALACNFCGGVLLDAVVAPNCMHAFCAPCIDAWVEARASACPACVASGARREQSTPLGDTAYAAGRLQPDLTLRSIASKVLPFDRAFLSGEGGENGKSSAPGGATSLEDEWNRRFNASLEAARRGAVVARGFLARGAPCVGGVGAGGGKTGADADAAATAATGTTITAGAPRFSRAAPPPPGAAALLLMTPDPTAPRRRNPGHLQRPYVRAPRSLTLSMLARYVGDRLRVTPSAIKWRFEARDATGRKEGGETADSTEAVYAVFARKGMAATIDDLATAAWGGSATGANDDFERLDRPLVVFYRT